MRIENEWRQWLYAIALPLVGNHDAAEDIVQEVLLRFWQATDKLPWQHPSPLLAKAICSRLVRFEVAQYYRVLSRTVKAERLELTSEAVIAYNPQEELIEQASAVVWLNALLPLLSHQQQAILSLLKEGYTFTEISHKMNVSVGAVKQQMNRIRQKALSYLSTTSEGLSELSYGGTNNNVGLHSTMAEEIVPSTPENAGGL